MGYIEFLDKYCEKYKLVIDKKLNGRRLSGYRRDQLAVLTYLLRIYYRLSYSSIETCIQINRQSALYFYYDTLANPLLRERAESRYKEIIDVATSKNKEG